MYPAGLAISLKCTYTGTVTSFKAENSLKLKVVRECAYVILLAMSLAVNAIDILDVDGIVAGRD